MFLKDYGPQSCTSMMWMHYFIDSKVLYWIEIWWLWRPSWDYLSFAWCIFLLLWSQRNRGRLQHLNVAHLVLWQSNACQKKYLLDHYTTTHSLNCLYKLRWIHVFKPFMLNDASEIKTHQSFKLLFAQFWLFCANSGHCDRSGYQGGCYSHCCLPINSGQFGTISLWPRINKAFSIVELNSLDILLFFRPFSANHRDDCVENTPVDYQLV